MGRTFYRREELQTTVASVGLVIMYALAGRGLLEPQPVFADNDDLIVERARQEVELIEVNIANVRERQLYLWLFGDLYEKNRRDVHARMGQKVSSIAANYKLTKSEYESILLASRADLIRLDREIAELRSSFEASAKAPQEMNDMFVKVQLTFKKALYSPNADSFFEKKANKILAGKARIPNLGAHDGFSTELLINRHKADVEAAVRILGKSVKFRQAQRQALIDLLLVETQPAKVFGDFDDVVVKYRLSQLPVEKLKPLFDDDQWPQVLLALDGLREFGPFLKRHGLVATGTVDDKPGGARPDGAIVAGQPAPAGTFVKSGEK